MPRITIRPVCVCQREGGEGGERRGEEREVRGGGGRRGR